MDDYPREYNTCRVFWEANPTAPTKVTAGVAAQIAHGVAKDCHKAPAPLSPSPAAMRMAQQAEANIRTAATTQEALTARPDVFSTIISAVQEGSQWVPGQPLPADYSLHVYATTNQQILEDSSHLVGMHVMYAGVTTATEMHDGTTVCITHRDTLRLRQLCGGNAPFLCISPRDNTFCLLDAPQLRITDLQEGYKLRHREYHQLKFSEEVESELTGK